MKSLILVGCTILSVFSLELRYDHQQDHSRRDSSSGSHGPRQRKCIIQKCPNQLKDCDKACKGIVNQCKKNCAFDSTCWQKCLTDANNDNATKFAKCGRDNKCWQRSPYDQQSKRPPHGVLSDSDICLKKKCPTQVEACDKPCKIALRSCHKCRRDNACWQKCLTDAKNDNAINFSKCGKENKCWK